MSRYIFEAWYDPKDKSVLLAAPIAIKRHALLSKRSKMLYRLKTETPEEAQAIHHLRQGWEPYAPSGDPAPCPKCKGPFYPEASGVCWKCGDVAISGHVNFSGVN